MRTVFQAITRSWTQHFVNQMTGFLIMSLTFGAAIFILSATLNLESFFKRWGQINQMTLHLKSDFKAEAKQKLENELSNHQEIASFQFINSTDSAKSFQKKFEELSSQKFSLNQIKNFFPQSYQVQFAPDTAEKVAGFSLESFASAISQSHPGISKVSYGKSWLERYLTIVSLFKYCVFGLVAVLLFGSIVAASSVIKSLLFSRREEIEILEFIGADDYSIYWPQIVNVAALFSFSFLTAIVMNLGIYQVVKIGASQWIGEVATSQLQFLSPFVLACLFIVSAFCILAHSIFTVAQLQPHRQRRVRG